MTHLCLDMIRPMTLRPSDWDGALLVSAGKRSNIDARVQRQSDAPQISVLHAEGSLLVFRLLGSDCLMRGLPVAGSVAHKWHPVAVLQW
eukprot:CAMPEP_0174367388 /NCGR_PEP_ID=MMETSP0811_2-20130205/85042_1 /TAXON_ID=73025 ORGANISM="Eutreptiella gymnastica-like, Strain CCMP1594" /NCGR_SAMPLE_ID=MMETSP0811_2 /ASSEMBLY_ACC=CAM_ASM_000667 /LENGTH=88 /DNA_ID=CAMNT_0015509899 /DNA_START=110 /DNA_END=377 /DNA_ORIENTATION=-